jgi:hypothetical protein
LWGISADLHLVSTEAGALGFDKAERCKTAGYRVGSNWRDKREVVRHFGRRPLVISPVEGTSSFLVRAARKRVSRQLNGILQLANRGVMLLRNGHVSPACFSAQGGMDRKEARRVARRRLGMQLPDLEGEE